MKEKWKYIEGSLHYAVSNLGRVKRLEHGKWFYISKCYVLSKERILKQSNRNSKRYWRIEIRYVDGRIVMESVHRLVAKAFVRNTENLPQVNHKDGNKNNNSWDNLEWCDGLYNIRHAIEIGLRPSTIYKRGTESNFNKHSEETIKRIPALVKEGLSYSEISRILGISRTLISEVRKGRTWVHLNLKFED